MFLFPLLCNSHGVSWSLFWRLLFRADFWPALVPMLCTCIMYFTVLTAGYWRTNDWLMTPESHVSVRRQSRGCGGLLLFVYLFTVRDIQYYCEDRQTPSPRSRRALVLFCCVFFRLARRGFLFLSVPYLTRMEREDRDRP